MTVESGGDRAEECGGDSGGVVGGGEEAKGGEAKE